jgi:hypothetical protein
MVIPRTQQELLQRIALETSRMSYPGSMSRGKKAVVKGRTKGLLEEYFHDAFPISSVWRETVSVANTYDTWHGARVREIADHLGSYIAPHNDRQSVAAKFLNTFMYQLMKYEAARGLFRVLHLPLDGKAFRQLKKHRKQFPSLFSIKRQLSQSPYSLPCQEHEVIQTTLWQFIDELNSRQDVDFQLSSRIELNWLWL